MLNDTIDYVHVNDGIPSCTNAMRHISVQIWDLLQQREKDRRVAKV